MNFNVDSVEYIRWSAKKPNKIKSGLAFYEINLPKKYLEFDRIYAFSNIIPNSNSGRIYFKNASPKLRSSTPQDYLEATARYVSYDGFGQVVNDKIRSTLCICEPGNYIKDRATSWYSVVNNVDICEFLAEFISYWLEAASLNYNDLFMFGSSAGSFGALKTATFLGGKSNVMVVNAQIIEILKYNNCQYKNDLLKHYQKCLQKRIVIPNIYLLCNLRDKNTILNRKFFDLITEYEYERNSTYKPNISFDLYDGLNGHLRPRKQNLLQKIDLAEAILKSSQDEQNYQREQDKLDAEIVYYQEKINLEPNCSSHYRILGKYQQKKGDIEAAGANYYQAIKLNPKQPTWLYRCLGNILSKQEQLEEAIEVYQQAILIQPNQLETYQIVQQWLFKFNQQFTVEQLQKLKIVHQAIINKTDILVPVKTLVRQNLKLILQTQEKLLNLKKELVINKK